MEATEAITETVVESPAIVAPIADPLVSENQTLKTAVDSLGAVLEVKTAELAQRDEKIERMRDLLKFLRDDVVSGNEKHVKSINQVL